MSGKLNMDFTAMDGVVANTKLLGTVVDSQHRYADNTEIAAANFGALPDGQQAGAAIVGAETQLAKSFDQLHTYLGDMGTKLDATRKSTSETEADTQWQFVKMMQGG